MNVAARFADALHALGIRRVYGLPGEDHMAVLDALESAGLGYCTAFNESSAVIMAATEAQLTGVPGVAVLSLAPGVSNGVNGLLNTYLDQIPLLLVSGQHPAGRLPLVVRQGFDIEQLVAPVTKWRARITADMDITAVVGKALDEAMSGRPGPVYLELPDEVASAAAPDTTAEVARRTVDAARRWRHRPATPAVPHEVAALRERFAAAHHPVLVLGGRRRRVAPETVRRFAERVHVPVFTTSRQMGVLDTSSPFFAGTFLNGSLETELFERADLVVLIDPEPFDFYNRAWSFRCESVAVIDEQFSEWLNPFSQRLVGDPEQLLNEISGLGPRDWTAGEVAAYRDHVRTTIVGQPSSLSVAAAVDTALRAFPRDGYLVADAGFSKPPIVMLSDLTRPDHFFASHALSTMGYSIPAAMALRRSEVGPVLAFLGDGSLLMRSTELMVRSPATHPLIVVAMLDRSLSQIEVKQERRKLAEVGVELPTISCAKLAEAFGIHGTDVTTVEELHDTVSKALTGTAITLVGALVDPAPSRPLFEALRG